MTVWCTISTIFKQRLGLLIAGLLTLSVALTTTLLFGHISFAAPGVNQTINFQGRLQYPTGGAVADGHYNIQFKLYQGGDGQSAGNTTGSPSGTLKWTETRINNGGTSGVDVKNGYFTVDLGSVNPFGSSVDWNDDTLWLSMNIAGSATACTTFGSSPCTADGEMLPMQRLTAVPYAINSSQLGGKTAQNFVQLAQGVQTDVGTNTNSIVINKTGTGGSFLQLQNAGSDVFKVLNTGDVELGGNSNRSLYVGTAATDTSGSNLTLFAGYGGGGSGSNGGDLQLLGGGAGGTDGNGGNIIISGGTKTGSGYNGGLYLGAAHTDTIQIGNTSLSSSTQTINIGTNNTTGGTTNITIGAGGSATGGTTAIQSKDDTTISTNGTQRARFSGGGDTLYVGNADGSGQASTATSFIIQGTSSTGSNVQGGSLTLQAGAATSGNANGGNITISGGAGVGTGATGLVVINTPTFATAAVQSASTSTNVTQANIDGRGVILLNATANNVEFTLGTPSLGSNAAGRIVYVTADNGSYDFMLKANVGGGAGVEQYVPMKQNYTTTMVWTGSVWTVAGTGGSGTLQAAYDGQVQSTGEANVLVSNNTTGDGLVIRDSSGQPTTNSVLSVQTSSASPLLSVNSLTAKQLATNPGAETAGGSSSTFPANTWSNTGIDQGGAGWWDSEVTRYTTTGNNIYSGAASTKVVVQNGWTGTRNKLNATLVPGVNYTVSLKLRSDSGTISTFGVYFMRDGNAGTPWTLCTNAVSASASAWTTVNCTFTAPSSGITSNNSLLITTEASTGTFYVDDLSVTRTNATSNVQIGEDTAGTNATYLTLGKSATPPADGGDDALLGSMYYDTTLSKVQCYEADGWGACGAAPDTFITLSPEYANAVMNGNDIGTISSDLCSDTLNINDGSSGQPTICGTNETFNFYKWTSAQTSNQTRGIYITYQLPSNFKEFVAGSTSLKGRTDSADSDVTYQIYRNNSSGLTSCGSAVSVSTGSQSSWQTGTASGGADPSACGFQPGESVLIRINLTSKDNANAYVSNLNFTYSNNN